MINIDYIKLRNFLIINTNKKIEDLCKDIGITRPTYYRILNKTNNSIGINLSTLNKICEYYGENPTKYLLFNEA